MKSEKKDVKSEEKDVKSEGEGCEGGKQKKDVKLTLQKGKGH